MATYDTVSQEGERMRRAHEALNWVLRKAATTDFYGSVGVRINIKKGQVGHIKRVVEYNDPNGHAGK